MSDSDAWVSPRHCSFDGQLGFAVEGEDFGIWIFDVGDYTGYRASITCCIGGEVTQCVCPRSTCRFGQDRGRVPLRSVHDRRCVRHPYVHGSIGRQKSRPILTDWLDPVLIPRFWFADKFSRRPST